MTRKTLPYVALVVFVVLGALVRRPPAPELDAQVSRAVQAHVAPGLGAALHATNRALDPRWQLPATIAFVVLVLAVRGRRAALLVLTAALLTLGLTAAAKRLAGRPRPPPTLVAGGSTTSVHSYPSGHVSWTTALAGGLWLALARRSSRARRALLLAAVLLSVAWVALGRIYAGRHYLTDTVGGALLGLAVLGLVVPLFEGTRGREVTSRPAP